LAHEKAALVVGFAEVLVAGDGHRILPKPMLAAELGEGKIFGEVEGVLYPKRPIADQDGSEDSR
jgi:hypothetical protein